MAAAEKQHLFGRWKKLSRAPDDYCESVEERAAVPPRRSKFKSGPSPVVFSRVYTVSSCLVVRRVVVFVLACW